MKNPNKKRKNGNVEKKTHFFLMSQGSLNPKIRFLYQKVCSVAAYRHTDRQKHRQTHGHEREYRGHHFRFQEFSFNLSSRIGPIFVMELYSIKRVDGEATI